MNFLSKKYTFVGVNIVSDIEKLKEDYEIRIGGKTGDLSFAWVGC